MLSNRTDRASPNEGLAALPPPSSQARKLYHILARNTASTVMFAPLTILIQLVTFAFMVRLLDLEAYGILMLASAIVGHFAMFDAGLATALEKFIPQFRAQSRDADISHAVMVTLAFFSGVGVFVALALLGFVELGGSALFDVTQNAEFETTLHVAAAVALLSWPLQTFSYALKGFNRHHELNRLNFFQEICRSIALVGAAYAGLSIPLILLCSSLPGLAVAIPKIRLLLRVHRQRWLLDRRSWAIFREMFDYSAWILAARLAGTINGMLDRVIVSFVLGVDKLPIYVALMRPLRLVIQSSAIVRKSVLPIASELHMRHGREGLHDLAIRGSRVMSALFAPVAATFVVVAEPALRLWVGEPFAVHAWSTQIGCFLLLFLNCRSFVAQMALGMESMVRILSLFGITAALLYAVTLYFAAGRFGIAGAVLAYATAHLALLPMWYWVVFTRTRIDFADFVLRSVVGGQWPAWLVIAAALPWNQQIGRIANWAEFTGVFALTATAAFGLSWAFAIEAPVRNKAIALISARLKREPS